MRRAAKLARTTAIQTDTEIILVKNGKPVRITAQELRKEQHGAMPSGTAPWRE